VGRRLLPSRHLLEGVYIYHLKLQHCHHE
jgi:hypothetical protein